MILSLKPVRVIVLIIGVLAVIGSITYHYDTISEKVDNITVNSDVQTENSVTSNEEETYNGKPFAYKGKGAEFDLIVKGSSSKPKACFVSLVRNSELWALTKSIKSVQDRFNEKFNYPWVFLNDEPFNDEFKNTISNLVPNAKFGVIPQEHWSYPDYISKARAAETRKKMSDIIYGGSESYRHMCRFQSGFFFRHPLLDEYDWYWRVEPDTFLTCDVDFDVFKYMQDNKFAYGFTITIHEYLSTIPTLWETTKNFVSEKREYLHSDNLLEFVSGDEGETYNLCHFWSNFEIANLNFYRSQAYLDYFDYLDHEGGFFYERWGDAPVHSIAASLFLPRSMIHYFDDIGYYHPPYYNCPFVPETREKGKCFCNPQDDFTFKGYACGKEYFAAQKLTKPANWENFS